jgi:hypothetical protein
VTNREQLSELRIGVVLTKRPAERISRWRAPMTDDEGAAEIRAGIVAQSSFVKVILTDDVRTLPRPFSVAWQDSSLET